MGILEPRLKTLLKDSRAADSRVNVAAPSALKFI